MPDVLEAPARDLCRNVPFQLTRAADGNTDGLTLEGYAAVFNTPTRIDSWEGTFDEQIAKGAFRKTLAERTPVLQFDHGSHPLIGSLPLGVINTAREDNQGVFVQARLADNWLVQPFRDAIANGSVDGMSFRFEVVRDEWRDAKGNLLTDPREIMDALWSPSPDGVLQRTLKELKVPELGPVVFPAYETTTVSVRSQPLADAIDAAEPADLTDLIRALYPRTLTRAAPPEQEHPARSDDSAPLDEHPEETGTTDTPPSDEEHLSAPTSRAQLRDAARELREYVNSIKKGASRYGG